MTTKEEYFTNPDFIEDYHRAIRRVEEIINVLPDDNDYWKIKPDDTFDIIEEKALRASTLIGIMIGTGVAMEYKESQPHITYDTMSARVLVVDLSREIDVFCQKAGVREKHKFFFSNDLFFRSGISTAMKTMAPDDLVIDNDALMYWVSIGSDFFIQDETEEVEEKEWKVNTIKK
jgi:hypothetical protein